MNASFDKKSATEGILTLQLEPQDYQATWEKNITHYKQKVNLKGFRKGHAPKDRIKAMYGSQLLEESIFQVAHHALLNYVREYQLETLGAPLLTRHNIYTISPKNLSPCTLFYKIGLTPEFDLPNPAKLNIKAYKITTVEEENLNKIIQEIQKSYATFQQVETAQAHHILYGNLLINDQAIEEPYYIELNEKTSSLHPILLEQKVNTTIPLTTEQFNTLDTLNPLPEKAKEEAQHHPNATFAFHIQTIYERQPHPLNKDFYTKVLGTTIETEDAFKEKLRKTIVQRDQEKADALLQKNLKETFTQAAEIPLPDDILKVWIQTKQEKNIDPEEINAQYPLYAAAIRWDLILDKLTKVYQLHATPEEIQARLIEYLKPDTLQQESTTTEAQLQEKAKNLLQNNNKVSERVARKLREEKALQLIKAQANIQPTPINSHAFYALLQNNNPSLSQS